VADLVAEDIGIVGRIADGDVGGMSKPCLIDGEDLGRGAGGAKFEGLVRGGSAGTPMQEESEAKKRRA